LRQRCPIRIGIEPLEEEAMQEARFYDKIEDEKVKCYLCAHGCVIDPRKRGICMVRENRDGTLYSLVYGKVISQNVDPIEKKPLFHFLPGSTSYSIATVGCNFQCEHCQNFEISQFPRYEKRDIPGQEVAPAQIVAGAKNRGCASISYTYTEPTIFGEYAYDTAMLAKEAGIRNVFVSNGFMSEKSAKILGQVLDADNIDLKSFSESFYRKVCKARLQPILDTIKQMKELGVWLEVTTLIIPGLNDSDQELKDLAGFIKSVGADIPWHVSAFYPTYKMLDRPRTPVETLRRARQIGLEAGLRYVYTGNIPGEDGEKTFCYACGAVVIDRLGYTIRRNFLKDGTCAQCGATIDGVWK
jgi:pyruvate formate lyase activating enzyme